jgi:hypothetical protein
MHRTTFCFFLKMNNNLKLKNCILSFVGFHIILSSRFIWFISILSNFGDFLYISSVRMKTLCKIKFFITGHSFSKLIFQVYTDRCREFIFPYFPKPVSSILCQFFKLFPRWMTTNVRMSACA